MDPIVRSLVDQVNTIKMQLAMLSLTMTSIQSQIKALDRRSGSNINHDMLEELPSTLSIDDSDSDKNEHTKKNPYVLVGQHSNSDSSESEEEYEYSDDECVVNYV